MRDKISGGILRAADRMSKIAVITVVAAVALFGSFMAYSAYSDSETRNALGNANQSLSSGDYQKAAALYGRYLAKNPGNRAALLGLLSASAEIDAETAKNTARELLASDKLTVSDFPWFIDVCAKLFDSELNVSAYSRWLTLSPGHIGAMIDLAGEYIETGTFDPALEIIRSLLDSGRREVAVILLGQAVKRARDTNMPAREIIPLCELWAGTDGGNIDALLFLAKMYAEDGRPVDAERTYRESLLLESGNAEAYDGLIGLIYQNERLRERYDLLESAIRESGGTKYEDLLATTREKLAQQSSTIKEDGITYRDGIFKVTRFGPGDVEITQNGVAAVSPDEISLLVEYYDDIGDSHEMFLDSEEMLARLEDIDYDGIRELIVTEHPIAGIDGVSEDAADSVDWRDIYKIDREAGRLVYSTPEYPNYYKNTFAREVAAKLARFENLSEGMEGHYGVTYGLLYAMRQAAQSVASGEWQPDLSGDALRARLAETLLVAELNVYAKDKNTMYGELAGDTAISADTGVINPGMTEDAVKTMLGAPRHVTEEEMTAKLPDGRSVEYLNRIVEYSGLNLYTNDNTVKGIRVNSRDYHGPRGLRIGDNIYDIINKYPHVYFDDVARYPTEKADGEVELVDGTNGLVLNYSLDGGVIMGIEIYFRDATGNWKPGTNVETVTTGMGVGAAGAGTAEGADEDDETGGSTDTDAVADGGDTGTDAGTDGGDTGTDGDGGTSAVEGTNDIAGAENDADTSNYADTAKAVVDAMAAAAAVTAAANEPTEDMTATGHLSASDIGSAPSASDIRSAVSASDIPSPDAPASLPEQTLQPQTVPRQDALTADVPVVVPVG